MLYIRHHKNHFRRVLHRERLDAKWLHLDVVYLSPTSASVFGRRLPCFGASKRSPSGVPSGGISTCTSIYRKVQTVSPVRHVWGSFEFRHNGNISRKQCVTVGNVWGTCGARKRCLGLRYRGMRRNTIYCTSREIEALLGHFD